VQIRFSVCQSPPIPAGSFSDFFRRGPHNSVGDGGHLSPNRSQRSSKERWSGEGGKYLRNPIDFAVECTRICSLRHSILMMAAALLCSLFRKKNMLLLLTSSFIYMALITGSFIPKIKNKKPVQWSGICKSSRWLQSIPPRTRTRAE